MALNPRLTSPPAYNIASSDACLTNAQNSTMVMLSVPSLFPLLFVFSFEVTTMDPVNHKTDHSFHRRKTRKLRGKLRNQCLPGRMILQCWKQQNIQWLAGILGYDPSMASDKQFIGNSKKKYRHPEYMNKKPVTSCILYLYLINT